MVELEALSLRKNSGDEGANSSLFPVSRRRFFRFGSCLKALNTHEQLVAASYIINLSIALAFRFRRRIERSSGVI